MVTYYNYYGVEPGTDKYDAIAESNIIKSLQNAFNVEDMKTADLAAEAEDYIRSIGLNDRQIAQLRLNLTGKQPEDNSGKLAIAVVLLSLSTVAILLSRRKRRKE
jgi:hypothetical protein